MPGAGKRMPSGMRLRRKRRAMERRAMERTAIAPSQKSRSVRRRVVRSIARAEPSGGLRNMQARRAESPAKGPCQQHAM